MPGSPVNEIISGYIEEVQTYIPSLTQGIESLQKDYEQEEIIDELHSLVHTVQGASSMVGIFGLSNITLLMANALSEIKNNTFKLNEDACNLIALTVNRIEKYCDDILSDGVNSHAILKEIIPLYRRLLNMPEEKDQEAVSSVLEQVPEYEGGPDSSGSLDFPDFSDDVADDEIYELPDDMLEDITADDILADDIPDPKPVEPGEKSGREQAQMPDIIPELLDSFYEEAKEHMEDLDGSLNTLESQITSQVEMSDAQKEIIRKIRRSVHTVKGAAAVIGLSNISSWGHIMEDFLDWLYEETKTIDPAIVELLMDSGDLLASIIASPLDPQTSKCEHIKKQYNTIIGTDPGDSDENEQGETGSDLNVSDLSVSGDLKEEIVEKSPEPRQEPVPDNFSRQTQTLRVGTERVDELVNLTGELIIASSAFDQQMSVFIEAANELEWARNRLREIARNMEVGYEVKALGNLKTLKKQAEAVNACEPDTPDQVQTQVETQAGPAEFDSLELDSYSELSMIIRTLNELSIDVSAIYTRYTGLHSEFDGHINRQRVLLSELQDKMMKVRMLPMSTLSNKLRRTVREVSKMLGKKIRLVIIGEEIELDRLVWEKITDPLMHLLRNSSDHGIEFPEIRKKKNKPQVATIKLEAYREGNQVIIRISDDGAGLNYENIKKKAIQTGFINKGTQISEQELASLIFKPGLSTTDKISQVSGRGVGMDVVRENIQELKGSVRVASEKDRGTQFTIRIPLTFAAVRALLFSVSDQTLAIALNEISDIIRIEPQNLIDSPTRAIKTGDKILPLYSLKHFIKSGNIPKDKSVYEQNPIVLVTGSGNDQKALEIDTLIGQQEIVIKSTGSHLRYVKGISGVTIIGDGNVVPILNIPELIGTDTAGSADSGAAAFDHEVITEKPLSIMIVDDSVSIRQVVSRLIEDQGWTFRIAKDGLDALEKLQDGIPDLILLDVEMPRMNGYEFLSAIGAEPGYKNVPVVMLTSRVTKKHREKAIALGAREFVAKPYNDSEFIELILSLTS